MNENEPFIDDKHDYSHSYKMAIFHWKPSNNQRVNPIVYPIYNILVLLGYFILMEPNVS